MKDIRFINTSWHGTAWYHYRARAAGQGSNAMVIAFVGLVAKQERAGIAGISALDGEIRAFVTRA